MAFDYASAARTARELIAEFGQTAYLRQAGLAMGESWNPLFVTNADIPIKVARLKNSRERLAAEGALERIYISTEGLATITPAAKDRVVIDGEVFEIMRIRPQSPAGIVIYWDAEIERG